MDPLRGAHEAVVAFLTERKRLFMGRNFEQKGGKLVMTKAMALTENNVFEWVISQNAAEREIPDF